MHAIEVPVIIWNLSSTREKEIPLKHGSTHSTVILGPALLLWKQNCYSMCRTSVTHYFFCFLQALFKFFFNIQIFVFYNQNIYYLSFCRTSYYEKLLRKCVFPRDKFIKWTKTCKHASALEEKILKRTFCCK